MDAPINIRGGFAVDTWTTECLGTALMGEGKTTTTLFTNHYQRRRKKNKINMKTIKESIEYNLQRANAILGTNYQNWVMLSTHKGLTEDFIREFADKVNWRIISAYQRLSEDFIREFNEKVDWYSISIYQHLSKEFIEEFIDKVDMDLIADSWHYKSTEDKKKDVIATGLYECYDDYFIAYKGIRADRCSAYNFQYQYLKGHTYETWCDCSDNEFGFGFSAWTEDGAKGYCDELVVRVKVRYEDVGRVVHDGGKIRCFKIEILD